MNSIVRQGLRNGVTTVKTDEWSGKNAHRTIE